MLAVNGEVSNSIRLQKTEMVEGVERGAAISHLEPRRIV